jgi:geranylgeranyl pyrophosphate synthase
LTDAIAVAGGGQYLDLASEAQPSASEEEAIDVAGRKTAALVAGACRVGARLGTDAPRVLDLLGRFGWHVGLADQLQNDLEGLQTERGKSDRLRGKPTLPAIAARTFGEAEANWASESPDSIPQMALADSGALHYTWVVMDLHRQQAKEIVGELGQDCPTEALLDIL